MDLSGKRTLVMGILNVTPDSFYDGGKNFDREKAIRRASQLYREGADIIDIGGESTRPGAEPVSAAEEIDRVCPVIEAVVRNMDIPISIDTYKSDVAREALKAGASIVNDISGFSFDNQMADVVSGFGAYVILMHIKGTPHNMQNDPQYEDLFQEIYDYLEKACEKGMNAGIAREKIIIDPGIGFGKTLKDNYRLINNIKYFKKAGFPVLIGLSRKSLISRLYDRDYDRLYATIALNAVSVMNGVDIIRVHDVEAHCLALAAVDMLKGSSNGISI